MHNQLKRTIDFEGFIKRFFGRRLLKMKQKNFHFLIIRFQSFFSKKISVNLRLGISNAQQLKCLGLKI
jgi:hypothetical protein